MGRRVAAAIVFKPMTVPEVSGFLREYFCSLPVETVEEIAHPGGNGDIFLINGDTVFRFPPSEEAAARLQVELNLLFRLARSIPLPIPHYRGSAAGPERLPLCACYPLIPGEPLLRQRFVELNWSWRWRNALTQQMGKFLTALHSFPTKKAVSCGLVESQFSLIEQVVRQNAAVRSNLYPHLTHEERNIVSAAFKGLLWEMRDYDPPLTLCHGRLSARRLLLAPGGDQLAGVIGWGGMTLGDPATDFTWRAAYGNDFFLEVLQRYHCPQLEPEQFRRVVAYHCELLPVHQMIAALKLQDGAAFERARFRLTRQQEP